jgi:hypothetical protein
MTNPSLEIRKEKKDCRNKLTLSRMRRRTNGFQWDGL